MSSNMNREEPKTTVGDFLIKSVEDIKKAHDLLQPVNRSGSNELARISNDVYKVFRDLSDEDRERYMLATDVADPQLTVPHEPRPAIPTSTHRRTPRYPPGLPMIAEEHASDPALEPKGSDSNFPSLEAVALQPPSPSTTRRTYQAPSWAKIAATPLPSDLDLQVPGFGTASILDYTNPTKNILPNPNEVEAAQKRVVFINGFKGVITLRDVTKHINEGALMSITITQEPSQPASSSASSPAPGAYSACVIFMIAAHAHIFLEKCKTAQKSTGKPLYGAGTSVLLGNPWPEDDEIRAMLVDKERRRLIFAAGGLFARVSREQFVTDVTEIAGAANIELVWLFNTGNATVVFASVLVARAVKEQFLLRGDKSAYEGTKINFCSDPCEKALTLSSQMLTGPEAAIGKKGKKRA